MLKDEPLLGSERRFLDFAAANTGGTNPNSLAGALHERVNGLQIQIPATPRHIVGMTDAMPELGPAATDFTNLCHKNTLRTHSRGARLKV